MIDFREKDGTITFSVRVVPRASRSEIAGEHDGALRVHIAAAPVEGAANDELIETIARALKIPRRAVEITSGHRSKNKTIRVTGAGNSTIQSLATGGGVD
jgi:uncharacterized protein (TIGR00251 family)